MQSVDPRRERPHARPGGAVKVPLRERETVDKVAFSEMDPKCSKGFRT